MKIEPKIDLFNEDCLPALKAMPDKAFDLAIVDPPYGINSAEKGIGKHTRIKIEKKILKGGSWDSKIPKTCYFNELFRCSKNQMIFGGNYFPLPPTRGFVVWHKGNGMIGRDFAECEYIWTSFDCNARIIYYDLLADSKERREKIHPNQRPFKLYKILLKNYANQGDKILDTHLGSGSIAIACYDMGFDLVGYEIDESYFKAAVNRLEQHKKQLTLF